MKKVLTLGLAAAISVAINADQQNWNTANTFLRFETPFQSASAERLALFNAEGVREKHRAAHHGDIQFTIFGGQNNDQANAAAYYMPNGLETLVFNASIDQYNQGSETAITLWNGSQGGDAIYAKLGLGALGNCPTDHAIAFSTAGGTTGTPLTDAGTTAANSLAYMTGTGTTGQPITNWTAGTPVANNFVVGQGGNGSTTGYVGVNLNNVRGLLSDDTTTGSQVAIGSMVVDANKDVSIMRPWNFGVGYAPNVQFGSPISESAFLSTITPELKRSHWGIGASWKQLLTEKDTGIFVELSTALQRVTMNMELNEVVALDLVLDPQDNPTGIWEESWTTNFSDPSVTNYVGADTGDVVAPVNMQQAFAQSAWNYGRIDGAQSMTRLADIELKLGYQYLCEENVMASSFAGIIIPTGNKATAEYLAEPIVGNGFHFGVMLGSNLEVQLNSSSETRYSMRSDANWRYLFQNTQVRSFDVASNGQWSRYMMVWPNYEAEQTNGELGSGQNLRAYEPGINVFTQEMYVTPRAQARMNQAFIVERGSFKGEFGWNTMIRQAEEVSLVNAWADNTVAFVDASNNITSLFNANRTIYNDAYQSTPVTNGGTNGTPAAGLSQTQYNLASIKATDLNLDSAASPAAFTNTPYLALGYAFNEEKSSVFSLGASYEVSGTNGYINNWTLWGKFGFSF